MICFNSRTHAGCDQKGNNSVAPNPMFQFTHPRGVRHPDRITGMGWVIKFQFTHPRGVRLDIEYTGFEVRGFNSRTHAGCDVTNLASRMETLAFQFTHPRGVRPGVLRQSNMNFPFQFTHPRGVRPSVTGTLPVDLSFQFTHPRGVRPLVNFSMTSISCFNSRTHAGCDSSTNFQNL